jgi:hypothetical protein
MITDRDFLRAERDYLTPPDACDDVHCCEQCGALGESLDPATARHASVLSVDEGALICGDCATSADADAERDAVGAASVALAFLAMKWRRHGTGIPSRRHFDAVEVARSECASGLGTRYQREVRL